MSSLIVEKTYSGSQTRELRPVQRNFIGIKGDSFSATLKFKIPKEYDTGWTKYIEFDAILTDSEGTEYTPIYVLTNNQFALPGDLLRAVGQNELQYNLKFVNTTDATIIEKSKLASLTVEDSNEGTIITPASSEDPITRLERIKLNKPTVTGTVGQILAKGADDTTYWKDDSVREIVTEWGATPVDTKVPSEKLVKDSLDGKQDTLSTAQLSAVNSGITGTKVSSYDEHISSTSNPHQVTKSQVGLSNVDNTSDANKPISTATQQALNLKANTSNLATVATSGSYNDLSNRPAIPSKTSDLTNDTLVGDVKVGGTSVVDSNKVAQIASTSDYSSSNPLTTRDFVNSSIATNTANYISNNGEPFTSVEQLRAYTGTVTNNDYAFVTGTESGNSYYDRYKATVSGSTITWAKEYRLNNSSFTAQQWGAINSGLSSTDKTKLDGIANGAEVNVQSNWSETDSTSDAYIQNKPLVPNILLNQIVDVTGARNVQTTLYQDSYIIGGSTAITAKYYTSTGQNTNGAMTQKAITDAVNGAIELFECTYGSTTYAEVTQALSDGKIPYCVYGNLTYIFCKKVGTSSYWFSTISGAESYYISVNSNDGWGNGATTLQPLLSSGITIKTINDNSALGSGNLDVKDVFECTYGTTTLADITTAYNAGKIVICKIDNNMYVLTHAGSSYVCFTYIDMASTNVGDGGAVAKFAFVNSSSTWSATDRNIEICNNKVTSISSTSGDYQYPSAKCVYDALVANDKIFMATFTTGSSRTTHATIYGAYTAGKYVYLYHDTDRFLLYPVRINADYATFCSAHTFGTTKVLRTVTIYEDDTYETGSVNLTTIDDSSTSSTTATWSASKLNTMLGNIESALDTIRGTQ